MGAKFFIFNWPLTNIPFLGDINNTSDFHNFSKPFTDQHCHKPCPTHLTMVQRYMSLPLTIHHSCPKFTGIQNQTEKEISIPNCYLLWWAFTSYYQISFIKFQLTFKVHSWKVKILMFSHLKLCYYKLIIFFDILPTNYLPVSFFFLSLSFFSKLLLN